MGRLALSAMWMAVLIGSPVVVGIQMAQAGESDGSVHIETSRGDGLCEAVDWSPTDGPKMANHVFTGAMVAECRVKLLGRTGDMDAMAKSLVSHELTKAVTVRHPLYTEYKNKFRTARISILRTFGDPSSTYDLPQNVTVKVNDDKTVLTFESITLPESEARVTGGVINQRNILVVAHKVAPGEYVLKMTVRLTVTRKVKMITDGIYLKLVKGNISKQVGEGLSEIINSALSWL